MSAGGPTDPRPNPPATRHCGDKVTPVFDLDAYLYRIGAPRDPTLAEVHRAHVMAIPFENLDPRAGLPLRLDSDSLARKLVEERRGGYCFEHNVLFAHALEALGAEVEPILARVRVGAPVGTIRGRTHLLLRVTMDGEVWHADVGFGVGTLMEPIPFGPSGVHEQWGWRFRVVPEGKDLVLQTQEGDAWRDAYAFEPEPSPPIDIELGNWYTSTHPDSLFVYGLIVARHLPDGTRVWLSDWSGTLTLTRSTPRDSFASQHQPDELPGLLSDRFGLPGFAFDADAQLVRGVS
jgi:N-hydroxyarylamine O-acetyltransferase